MVRDYVENLIKTEPRRGFASECGRARRPFSSISVSKTPLRFGFKVAQDATAEELRSVWQIADGAGFDHLWCLDLYASIGDAGPDRPTFEGWALQAAMAVATKRIRIGCTFTGNTHRPPWMLATLGAS